MRHHLQNTCSKQAHILLNVKPVKLQITAPGPRGAHWPRVVWTSIWVYRPSLSGRHGWFEAVSCASAGQGRGRCTLWGRGPGAGSQKEHRVRSPELTLSLSCPPMLALQPPPSRHNASRLHITFRGRIR